MTTGPSSPSAASPALRLAARFLLAGQLLFILVTQFHKGGDANDHHSIFASYAHSGDWKGVHALQFAAVAGLTAGLVILCSALEISARRPIWAGRVGGALAVVSLGLYGVLQAVDGIGNKQVDHAWLTASGADRSARFASAEAMRWLEWGMSSYHAYAMGLALLALAAAVATVDTVAPRVVGGLIALSGLVYMAEGWVAGSEGFNATHSVLIVASWILSLTWMVWLVVITGRASDRGGAPAGPATAPAEVK